VSRKASKSLIGGFVLGAVVLIVAAVIVFGSGQFFHKTYKFVLFFEGSVKGLNAGAPVMFHGVKVGRVTDIRLTFRGKELTMVMPVYIELDASKVEVTGALRKPGTYLQPFIKKGLRAQLQMQSFVTGQLLVNLDFYPGTPIKLVGLDKRYAEIPTIPAPLEELQKTVEHLQLDQLSDKLQVLITDMDTIAKSPELKDSIASLDRALRSFDQLARSVNAQIAPVATSLKETSDAARGALVQAEKTLSLKEGVPAELAEAVKETLQAAHQTLEETQKAAIQVRHIADQNAHLGYDVSRTLEEISALSRSLRSLSDYLEQHPEAIIRGKTSKGD
jgi:paraquat-inducible protein B